MKISGVFHPLISFYREGFRNMTIGKTLWLIIFIKLFIMFAVLRVFFFPNFLNSRCANDNSKADYVRMELINNSK